MVMQIYQVPVGLSERRCGEAVFNEGDVVIWGWYPAQCEYM